jgi:Fur family ferric uptake transcriptional regulator
MGDKKVFRNTRQRQVILEELRRLTSHPTATELYEIVRQRLPKVSLGTVYRNLELLNQLGAIRKLELGGSESRFDGNLTPHHHVRCNRCGRLDDLHGLPTGLVAQPHGNLGGYQIIGHRLEFIGICPDCQRHLESPESSDTPPH